MQAFGGCSEQASGADSSLLRESLDRVPLVCEPFTMRAVTIKEAKAKLNELIEAAANGEDVVILRGSEHVAAIIPITEADLELSTRITDEQARRLWRDIEAERAAGRARVFDSAEGAVEHLRARLDGAAVVREGRTTSSRPAKSGRSSTKSTKAVKRRRPDSTR